MSLCATKWAWTQCIKSTQKLVLLSLADRADDKNNCYPSVTRLSKDTCLDRKTVIKNISTLENLGLIQVKKRFGACNYYTIKLRETSTKNGTSTEIGTSTKNGTTPVPKTVLEPVPKTVHKSISNLPYNLPIYIDSELFADYLALRKKIKAVNSERAIKILIGKLEDIKNKGQDPNKAIERSIESSWKTVYEEKNNGNNQSKSRIETELSQIHRDIDAGTF